MDGTNSVVSRECANELMRLLYTITRQKNLVGYNVGLLTEMLQAFQDADTVVVLDWKVPDRAAVTLPAALQH